MLQREIARRDRVPARVLRLFYGLSYETVELNISKTKKEKKKEKRVAKVVLFNSAMALCFARLSLTLSFVVARKGKGGFIQDDACHYSESESDSD